MKRILLALTIVAIALAVAADEGHAQFELTDEELEPVQVEITNESKGTEGATSSATSQSGSRKYSGNINFDLFGSSSVQQTIDGIARAFQEALKLVGVNHTLSEKHNGTGRLQGKFEFSGDGNKNEKQSNGASQN